MVPVLIQMECTLNSDIMLSGVKQGLLKTFVRQFTLRRKIKIINKPLKSVKGSFSLTDIRDSRFPGCQTAATSLCALLQSKCLSPSSWTPEVLDKLLLQGDKLHTTRLHHLGRLATGNGSLTTQDLPTSFCFKHKELQLSLSKSDISLAESNDQCKTTRLSQELKLNFLENKDGVLITSGEMTVAVFVDDTYCYLFHPCKDRCNLSSTGESRSMLLKFRDFQHLSLYLSENFTKQTIQITSVRIYIKFDVWTNMSFSTSPVWV